jgi:hypothetical protein
MDQPSRWLSPRMDYSSGGSYGSSAQSVPGRWDVTSTGRIPPTQPGITQSGSAHAQGPTRAHPHELPRPVRHPSDTRQPKLHNAPCHKFGHVLFLKRTDVRGSTTLHRPTRTRGRPREHDGVWHFRIEAEPSGDTRRQPHARTFPARRRTTFTIVSPTTGTRRVRHFRIEAEPSGDTCRQPHAHITSQFHPPHDHLAKRDRTHDSHIANSRRPTRAARPINPTPDTTANDTSNTCTCVSEARHASPTSATPIDTKSNTRSYKCTAAYDRPMSVTSVSPRYNVRKHGFGSPTLHSGATGSAHANTRAKPGTSKHMANSNTVTKRSSGTRSRTILQRPGAKRPTQSSELELFFHPRHDSRHTEFHAVNRGARSLHTDIPK